MANGFGSFYVGSSGLKNSQNALNTTANNMANVNTTGYVRQQVRFSDKHYITRNNPTAGTNIQQSGLGVSQSLQKALWHDTSAVSQGQLTPL